MIRRKLFGRGYPRLIQQDEDVEGRSVADEMKKIARLRRQYVTEFTNVERIPRRRSYDR